MPKFKIIILHRDKYSQLYKKSRRELKKAVEKDGYEICGVVTLNSIETEVFLVNKNSQ